MNTSWFPFNFSFQNLTTPLSIQRRFISFILKRTLGHLLKPGQLNIDQIDAQIGNGFVEVKDLELDSTAVNSLWEGLPVQLQSGRIATVTARIPWPNPFSSTVGLSLSGIHLMLVLNKPAEVVQNMKYPTELAKSVASVAETFIHEELSEGEEAMLRGSVHLERLPAGANEGTSSNRTSGSLDLFPDEEPEPVRTADSDPEGVSIFAGLFERLLARFDFDASDTRITLIHSDNAALTLEVARIRYFTETVISDESSGLNQTDAPAGETRTVSFEGVTLFMRDLSPSNSTPSTPQTPPVWTSGGSISRLAHEGSDSEVDDETSIMMSQSLVSLPPRTAQVPGRAPSPSLSTISSASAASSMYQSAISASKALPHTASPHKDVNTFTQTEEEERSSQIIMTVSDTILIRLTTPPPYAPLEESPIRSGPDTNDGEMNREHLEKMKLDVSIGIIAVSLHARNVNAIVKIASFISKAFDPSSEASTRSEPQQEFNSPELSIFKRLELRLRVKGVVILLTSLRGGVGRKNDSILDFFSRPLIPPFIPCGYVRLHIDSVEAAATNPSLPDVPHSFKSASTTPSSSEPSSAAVSCTISDLSLLVFHSSTSSNDVNLAPRHNASSPILITDLNLVNSYRAQQTYSLKQNMHAYTHNHPYTDEDKELPLPVFDVVDWSSEKGRSHGSSLRVWRTRPAHPPPLYHRKVSSGLGAGLVSNVGLSTSPTRSVKGPQLANTAGQNSARIPAISAKAYLGEATAGGLEVIVKTVPLHVFIDLECASRVLDFVGEVLHNSDVIGPPAPAEVPSTHDRHRSTWTDDREQQRKRLEELVLDDLNLGMDYRQLDAATPIKQTNVFLRRKSHSPPLPGWRFEITVPLVRVEVRAPSRQQPRSGALVVDVHCTRYTSNPHLHSRNGRQVPRFEESDERNAGFEDWFSDVNGIPAAAVEMRRVVIAYAGISQSQAESVLSLGPVSDSDIEDTRDSPSPILPLICLRSIETAGSSQPGSTALLARLPSVHIVMNKCLLDGLQLWTDDVSQWLEKLNNGQASGSSTRAGVSRNPSLIGSRYFTRRAGSRSAGSEAASIASPGTTKSEFIVKAALSEVFIRLLIQNSVNVNETDRRLDVCASDLDALVEVKPEGKEETVVSLNIHSVNVVGQSSAVPHCLVTTSSSGADRSRQAVFKLRFRSVSLPGTIAKESRIRMNLYGLRISMWSDFEWIQDLMCFAKAPPGAFESVVPSERTQISVNILDCALRMTPPSQPSAIVLSVGDVGLSTELASDSKETALDASIAALSLLLTDDSQTLANDSNFYPETDVEYWMGLGYALLATVEDLRMLLKHDASSSIGTCINVNGMNLSVHLCADSISGIAAFATDLQTLFSSETDPVSPPRKPTDVSESQAPTLLRSLDEQAFRRQPVIGPLPDMIGDDLPNNPEYLDASFGAAAGFRPLDDNDEDEFYPEGSDHTPQPVGSMVSRHGGETIKMLCSPINIIENFYDTLTPSPIDFASEHGDTSIKLRAQDCNVYLLLYEGYDWERTRKAIQDEMKRVKRRLAKIRQLLANGQTYDPNVEDVNTVLFNSVYVGLDQDVEGLEREAFMAAIDEELDDGTDANSEGSWQSFKPNTTPKPDLHKTISRTRKLSRSKAPSIEFSLNGMAVDFDQYLPGANLASRLLFTIKDLEILDHIKTSTWSKFLTEMRTDPRGNVRETDSNMARVELQMLLPYQGHSEQEARLKAKLLPLRLHVDQDALDFLKKFFSFKDTEATPSPPPENEIFFQHVEIFPVDIKLDYKPRRVDYRALKEGKTIELMNFFHFDGAEMTLRHITLKGITGWPRMFDTLNDLWTPDVKANQLVDVISGVSPIRSAVNVGSGVADLILLPIAQYKKDGRIIRGLQKGTTAFVKSTAMEAIRLGARLATGTQVVLEQTETVLGGQFTGPVTAEALQTTSAGGDFMGRPSDEEDVDGEDQISKYAEQPTNIKEGMQSAYKTLSQNIKTAGQTILAVPMEVYERSGKEGPARAVIRAVPIAVLKPMIGASEAISKTLLGLHNTLDPQSQIDTEAKYKHR
ncbi:hypothetical protein M0805_008979 [Coniferiporia weirii]|nr:hypothetical protein M0805_008979 [Coniferiporia weirii]